MGSTPNYAIPYPEPTAPVRDGAANMRAIAERVATVLSAIAGGGNGLGLRAGSSVVQTDANGVAIIPISPPFVTNIGGSGCIPVAMNGDLGPNIIVGSYAAQAFLSQWTVSVKNTDGSLPPAGSGYRINWIVAGIAT